MATIESWILTSLLTIAPPEKIAPLRTNETEAEMRTRYAAIAHDLAEVIDNSTPLFKGNDAKEKTAALMLATAKYESDFDKDVDTGKRLGDGGNSYCLMQVHLGKRNVWIGTDEMKTWNGQTLLADRKKCFAVGMEVLRLSLRACGHMKDGAKISLYRFPACREDKQSDYRWNLAQFMFMKNKPVKVEEVAKKD